MTLKAVTLGFAALLGHVLTELPLSFDYDIPVRVIDRVHGVYRRIHGAVENALL